MTRISKIFVAAGLVNIVGVLVVSKAFTSDYAPRLDPDVFSWLGLVSIMLWGAAYIAVSRHYQNVPALLAVFFVEKLVYFGAWLIWILDPPVPLGEVFQHSKIVGGFFAGYGLIDLAFGLFFLAVLLKVAKTSR
ncbi:MAG: hypothetical protein O7A04_12685 [Acidobacteria bacterium]|nr:hypothetical protein [Acidobacteriota bacterium]